MEGYIITPRAPFQASNKQEINSLIIRGVFKFKKYNPTKFNEVYIFKSRIVNKIKGKATNALFKKLYRIIEAGTHWWATYSKHYKEKLLMTTFIFNLYFLIIATGTPFGIVGMQTN